MATHVIGTPAGRLTGHRLDAIGWGLFFIWVGIAVLANVGWGIGLAGVGVLVLAGQVARKSLGLTFEAFWAVVGALFVIGGVSEILNVRVNLIPIVAIVAGVGILVSAFRNKAKE